MPIPLVPLILSPGGSTSDFGRQTAPSHSYRLPAPWPAHPPIHCNAQAPAYIIQPSPAGPAETEPTGLGFRLHLPTSPHLTHTGHQPPSQLTWPSLASHSPPRPSLTPPLQVQPKPSPRGSVFGFARQTTPPSRAPASSPPSQLTRPSRAPH